MNKMGFVEYICPGFLFADAGELKVPKTLWDGDDEALAKHISHKCKDAVAFKRIAYSPSKGKVEKDTGWIYFKGLHFNRKDVLSGKAEKMNPNLKLNDTARSNIKYNDFDIIWLEDYGKVWFYEEDDKFVDIS